jgi:hypothetical protein
LRHLEEIGTPRVLVALTDDVFNITQAGRAVYASEWVVTLPLNGSVTHPQSAKKAIEPRVHLRPAL